MLQTNYSLYFMIYQCSKPTNSYNLYLLWYTYTANELIIYISWYTYAANEVILYILWYTYTANEL